MSERLVPAALLLAATAPGGQERAGAQRPLGRRRLQAGRGGRPRAHPLVARRRPARSRDRRRRPAHRRRDHGAHPRADPSGPGGPTARVGPRPAEHHRVQPRRPGRRQRPRRHLPAPGRARRLRGSGDRPWAVDGMLGVRPLVTVESRRRPPGDGRRDRVRLLKTIDDCCRHRRSCERHARDTRDARDDRQRADDARDRAARDRARRQPGRAAGRDGPPRRRSSSTRWTSSSSSSGWASAPASGSRTTTRSSCAPSTPPPRSWPGGRRGRTTEPVPGRAAPRQRALSRRRAPRARRATVRRGRRPAACRLR